MSESPSIAALDATPINRDWIRVVGWVVLVSCGLQLITLGVNWAQGRPSAITLLLDSEMMTLLWRVSPLSTMKAAAETLLLPLLVVASVVMIRGARGAIAAGWSLALLLIAYELLDVLQAVEGHALTNVRNGLTMTLGLAIGLMPAGMMIHYLRHAHRQPSWVRMVGWYLVITGILSLALLGIQWSRPMTEAEKEVTSSSLGAWGTILGVNAAAAAVAGFLLVRRPSIRTLTLLCLFIARCVAYFLSVRLVTGEPRSFTRPWVWASAAQPAAVALVFLYLWLRHGEYWSPFAPCCRGCGYPLVGLPAESLRCPECGRAIALPIAG